MWASLLQLLNKIASAFIDYLPDIIKNRKRKKIRRHQKNQPLQILKRREINL